MAWARSGRGPFWLATLALSFGLVATVWSVPYLPTNDGPESIFSAHAENHYADPGTIYSDQLIPTWQYASKGFSFVFGPLEMIFGWQNALRVTLTLTLLATAWATVWLVTAIHPRRHALGLLGFPLALSWPLYMGFFAFTMGSALGLVTLALVVKKRPVSRGQWAVVCALLFVQAVMHVFSAVLTGFVIASVCFLRAPSGARIREACCLLLAGAPAMLVLLGSALTPAPGQLAFMGSSYTMLPLADTLRMLPRFILPGPSSRAILGATVVGLATAFSLMRIRRMPKDGAERGLAFAAVGLLLFGVFAPLDIPGWQLMSPRFVPLGALLAVVLLPFETLAPRTTAVALAVLLFALSAGSLATSLAFHRSLVRGCSDVIAALSADVRRHGLALPVSLDPACGVAPSPLESEVPYLHNLWHIGALLATVEGGSTPYLFAGSPASQAFLVRVGAMDLPPIPSLRDSWGLALEDAFRLDEAYRREALDELATAGMFYEAVDVTGARPEDLSAWHARGFVADWEQGTVLLAHFEPCRLDITVPHDTVALPDSFDVGVGASVALSRQAVPETLVDDVAHFSIPRAPCGAVWVRPRWSDSHMACSNADGAGKVRAVVTRVHGVVACVAAGTRSEPLDEREPQPIIEVFPPYFRDRAK